MMTSNFGWMVIALILPMCVWNSDEACWEPSKPGRECYSFIGWFHCGKGTIGPVNTVCTKDIMDQKYTGPVAVLNHYIAWIAMNKIFYGGRELNITIEISHRVTHKIVSHILISLLKEALGYDDVQAVTIKGGYPTATFQRITSCENPKNCSEKEGTSVPETMINLELWLAAGFNTEEWIQTGEVIDCGPLGPVGRTGWYIPNEILNCLWKNSTIIADHWRAFQDPHIASIFHIPDEDLSNFMKSPDSKYRNYYCNMKGCKKGLYEPPICLKERTPPCATLLVDFPESTFSTLKSDIDYLELRVRVAWVGKDLETLVKERTKSEKPTLFFNWKPNTVTSHGNFTNVAFPHCDDSFSVGVHCKYEVNQLEKVVWSKIKTIAPEVFHLIRSMHFTQQNYLSLLKTYEFFASRSKKEEDVACAWLDQNHNIWHEWLLKGYEKSKPKLYIGGIFPMNGTYWHQGGIIIAAKMAVDAVNRNPSVLGNFTLELNTRDGHCAADEVMKSFINYVTNDTYKQTIGILGPACSDTVEPIAGVAKHYNTIIISYSAEGALVSNRDKYPYFFRTIPENSLLKIVYLKLFQSLNWNRVAAITEDGRKYPEYISLLHDKMQQSGMNFLINRKFPRDRAPHNMSRYLLDLKDKNARIIIGDFYDSAARAVMCEAYKQEMTGKQGYHWFLPPWFPNNWYDTNYYNKETSLHENVSCSTEQMIEAINGHMSLAYKYYADDDKMMQDQRTVGKWKEEYELLAKRQSQGTSIYGGYAYDAVWAYAYALHELLKENHSHVAKLHSPDTSRRYVELLNNVNFRGVTGDVYFEGSSRISDVIIWQWRDNKTYEVGIYHPEGSEDGHLILNESSIKWMTSDGRKPSDGTEGQSVCPLEGIRALFNVTCEIAIVIVNIMGFLGFAIVMLIGFLIFKRRYELKMKQTEARMRELGLISSSNLLTLDEWEMPRDHIVINRKLGEGAFGTVYGGEAFITDKGWVAVAVKTLKIGATVEEKLDFLSEAEMMKRFDHKNIVQLVGVCTMGEPVYTVMEFMLYGDLKTFLLARRHLVKEKEHEKSDEVSDRKLTNMALDVARGLSYLADLKYVHRDLACRNCLVNASRTVKIADFGMCRPMYDSDYYRFNKRGMLPVRWMAPESLIDGIFTPTSDVWSYGVLLYEIITFGSFPYQGLSNNQVLEYVKGYNTLTVPKGCRPELASLLLQCWCRNPQDRPSASEIVEILANHPKLIAPCLDMPMASVEVEDTDSIKLTICERTKVYSTSSSWPAKRQNGSLDQAILYRDREDINRIKSAAIKRHETSPVIDSPRIALQRRQYLTLQQKGTKGDSDYGSDASQDFPQSITSL